MTHSEDFAAAGLPDLMDHFGETVTRYPAGDSGAAETVTAIFSEYTSGAAARRDYMRGQETVRTAKLTLYDDQTVTQSDQWIVNSETWQTLEIKGTESGFRDLILQRNDIETRNTKGMGTGRL